MTTDPRTAYNEALRRAVAERNTDMIDYLLGIGPDNDTGATDTGTADSGHRATGSGERVPTRYQVAAQVRRELPVAVVIRPHESITDWVLDERAGRAMLTTDTAKVTRTVTQTRITHTGIRTVLLRKFCGEWTVVSDDTVWTKLDEPVLIQERGVGGKTVKEWLEHVQWQRDAYRPGMGGRLGQRDSYNRVAIPPRGQKRPTPGGIWTGE